MKVGGVLEDPERTRPDQFVLAVTAAEPCPSSAQPLRPRLPMGPKPTRAPPRVVHVMAIRGAIEAARGSRLAGARHRMQALREVGGAATGGSDSAATVRRREAPGPCLFLRRHALQHPKKEAVVVAEGDRITAAFNWGRAEPG
jgi:hypothetical protein